ncbi:MAG: hypothetical protein IVW52_03335 [Acidimicrobiales bacterium]|nr:hypothetical protein [Acidimicrobiales bacterium]
MSAVAWAVPDPGDESPALPLREAAFGLAGCLGRRSFCVLDGFSAVDGFFAVVDFSAATLGRLAATLGRLAESLAPLAGDGCLAALTRAAILIRSATAGSLAGPNTRGALAGLAAPLTLFAPLGRA